MHPFIDHYHYKVKLDGDYTIRGGQKVYYTSLTNKGKKLVADYYRDKFGCEIDFPKNSKGDYIDNKAFMNNVNNSLIDSINEARKNPDPFRKAFILGLNPNESHAIPLIYFKENGKEGLLYADTLFGNAALAEKIVAETKLPVYFVSSPRQKGDYGCYVDALVLSRDCTAKGNDGKYIYEKLFEKLRQRTIANTKNPHAKYTLVKLPDELLKTSQITYFVNENKENLNQNVRKLNQIIQKDETLAVFRERYEERADQKFRVGSFLRKKSNKFASVVQIQHYINQIKNEASALATPEIINLYRRKSKELLKKLEASDEIGLFKFSLHFLKNLKNMPKEEFINHMENINLDDFIFKKKGSKTEAAPAIEDFDSYPVRNYTEEITPNPCTQVISFNDEHNAERTAIHEAETGIAVEQPNNSSLNEFLSSTGFSLKKFDETPSTKPIVEPTPSTNPETETNERAEKNKVDENNADANAEKNKVDENADTNKEKQEDENDEAKQKQLNDFIRNHGFTNKFG